MSHLLAFLLGCVGSTVACTVGFRWPKLALPLFLLGIAFYVHVGITWIVTRHGGGALVAMLVGLLVGLVLALALNRRQDG